MDFLSLFKGLLQHAINAQRRQADGNMLLFKGLHQLTNQLCQAGIVAAGQTGQADFLIAGGIFKAESQFHQSFQTPLPYGAIQHARLTKATAPGASPHDFQHNAVMDNLRVRHGNILGVIGRVQIHHNPLVHPSRSFRAIRRKGSNGAVFMVGHIIQRRHVHPLQLRQLLQAAFPGFPGLSPCRNDVAQFQHDFFPVANHEGVNDPCKRFRIEGARASCHDDGILPATFAAAERNAGQMEHGKNVGVAHLVLQGKAHHIEGIHRMPAFQ